MGYGSEGPKGRGSKSGAKTTGTMETRKNAYGTRSKEFDFDAIDDALVGRAVRAALQNGCAIMFTYAGSTGVASSRLFDGDTKEVGYAKDVEEFNSLLEQTLAYFNPTT